MYQIKLICCDEQLLLKNIQHNYTISCQFVYLLRIFPEMFAAFESLEQWCCQIYALTRWWPWCLKGETGLPKLYYIHLPWNHKGETIYLNYFTFTFHVQQRVISSVWLLMLANELTWCLCCMCRCIRNYQSTDLDSQELVCETSLIVEASSPSF